MGEDRRTRAWAEVDLAALRRNYRALRARADGRRVIAVVKANGYGHGGPAVARALAAEGCPAFGVVTPDEARALRAAGVRAPVLLLNGLVSAAHADAVFELDLWPALYQVEDLQALDAAAGRAGRPAQAHLKLDTGMGRLGLPPAELDAFLARLRATPRVELGGVMSHLAEADDADSPATARQRALFGELVTRVRELGFAPAWVHLDNSAGLVRGPAPGTDAVRPGLSLYGPDPTLQGGHALEPVMSLYARVCQAKTLAPGARVGYGGSHVVERTTRVLTLAIGYADGLPRAAGNRFAVGLGGRRAPLVGRVSCDLATVDAGPDAPEGVGAAALVFGRTHDQSIDVSELAAASGTISYEILVRIGERVPRLAAPEI